MRIYSTSDPKFNPHNAPDSLTDWESVKQYEPRLAILEIEALHMQPCGECWWKRSRTVIDKLKQLAGRDSNNPGAWTTIFYDTCEKAIFKAFRSEVPA